MYSNSFDYAVDDFHFAVEEFLEDTEYMGICESLLLPVEEGIGDSFKKALDYLYKKFHAILEAFKRWVKKVINKVKSFFTRGKKKDSKEKDTTGNDSSKKSDPTPEEAKKVVEDMNEVLKTANNVDSELKKASSDENVTKEEADTVTKKADDVSKQMSDLKSRVETTYLIPPQKTEAGDKETGYDLQGSKQENAIAEDMANKNYFNLKHPEKYTGIVKDFIIEVGNIENGNKVRFGQIKSNVGTAADCIMDVLCYREDVNDLEDEGAKRMFAYMSQKIPKQIQEWIARKKKRANLAKDTGELDKIFVYEPTTQNLNRCISTMKRISKNAE